VVKLQNWAEENEPEDKMIYKKGYWDQIIFIRDTIPGIFATTYGEYFDIQQSIAVISDHTSKSIKLPVAQITTISGINLILRNNFHDWKISVRSPVVINGNFAKLFDPEEQFNHIYCEGFKPEWVFSSYSRNKSRFTVELHNGEYHIFTFLWIMANHQCSEFNKSMSL